MTGDASYGCSRVLIVLICFVAILCGVEAESTGPGMPGTTIYADQCDPSAGSTGTGAGEMSTWPSPVITSLYPSSIIAAGSPFTLTIDGNYFLPESRVLWDWQDRTGNYLSVYQMTAHITSSDIATPGQHYVVVQNPGACGGNSNISIFAVRDGGQTFPLYTYPLNTRLLRGQSAGASIIVHSLSKGLQQYNLTLYSDAAAPFSFFFVSVPSWVSDPSVTILDPYRLQITGNDGNDRITNASSEVPLVNISVMGSQIGTGNLQVILNEAIADDGTRYGSGYTSLPVEIRQIMPFNTSAGVTCPLPTDIDADGLYEDINGNGRLDLNDVVMYFANIDKIRTDQPLWAFDYDRNGFINLHDLVTLFQMTLRET